MALKRKGGYFAFSAILAAIAIIWSGSTDDISARTQYFGADRMSFESMPGADGAMCEMPEHPAVEAARAIQEAQAAALPPTVEALLSGGGNICELPSYASAGAAGGARASQATQQKRPLPPSVGERARRAPRSSTGRRCAT
jgi:hypothetical protein